MKVFRLTKIKNLRKENEELKKEIEDLKWAKEAYKKVAIEQMQIIDSIYAKAQCGLHNSYDELFNTIREEGLKSWYWKI